ncbi:MAG: thioredoxin family protein [Desulfobacteraceae bacterium]|nr:thioredoxin family protein [Desulfobacteraceae bacterium]
MKIEVIETTDKIRMSLFGSVLEALRACRITGKVVVVKDIKTILKYGVKSAPALIINGIVIFAGKSQSPEEIIKLIQQCISNIT